MTCRVSPRGAFRLCRGSMQGFARICGVRANWVVVGSGLGTCWVVEYSEIHVHCSGIRLLARFFGPVLLFLVWRCLFGLSQALLCVSH